MCNINQPMQRDIQLYLNINHSLFVSCNLYVTIARGMHVEVRRFDVFVIVV